MELEEIIEFEALYDSSLKCRCNVSWKPSTKHFTLNGIEECLKMEAKLKSGKWKNGKPKPILITHPKRREGLSISFRDRVYQRSLNDNALYPLITKSFIYDNAACQKGKGTDFARERLKKHLRNFYCNHGLDGYVLQIDIKGYYANMRHDKVREKFHKHLPDDVWKLACDVLDTQYSGDVGYNPGSQMVQIAGISLLDELDHYIKEQLHEKYYIRYMDDLWILGDSEERLKDDLEHITEQLATLGLRPHPTKTHIIPLRKGFRFLGFNYRMTDTGKVLMFLTGENVKAEKRKLKRMAKKVKRGELTREKVDECYNAWKAHASKGNSYKLLKRMDAYYQNLWRDSNGNDSKKDDDDPAGEGTGTSANNDTETGGTD